MITKGSTIEHLLPARHQQQELFICDVADAVLKDVMQHMEHPFYSLSKKPETRIRRYEHKGNWLEIIPSVKGQATIYDKDILIYCISQIMAKLNNGEPVSERVRINSHELLIFTNRGTAGKDYVALSEAIDRLAGTRISTNIKSADEEQYDNFGLIDAASIRRKNGLDGRLLWCDVTLSNWVFNAIRASEVLTLHPDYFRLRKPMERRIYELARKHCGQQAEWHISLDILLKKSGSQSPMKRFKQMIAGLADHNHLPDYHVRLHDDKVTFTNRNSMRGHREFEKAIIEGNITLSSDIYSKAREAAPGYDVHYLEQEWLSFWEDSGKPKMHHADAAFIAFCHRRYKRNPNP
ncbi:MAG: replication initiator protein A [Chloroflexota bacterium]